MAFYIISSSGQNGLFEKGLAKLYMTDENGKASSNGDYKKQDLPGASKEIRPQWDQKKSIWDVADLSDKDLQETIIDLSLQNDDKDEQIESANKKNRRDPFFNNIELYLDIKSGGTRVDDETAIGRFWLAVARANHRKFDINGETDNPLDKQSQEFEVTKAGINELRSTKDQQEVKRATKLLFKLTYKQQKAVARGFEIQLGDDPEPDVLEEVLHNKITAQKDHKHKGSGLRNIDYFFQMTDMPEDDLNTRDAVQLAIDKRILVKDNKNIMFDKINLGTTVEAAAKFLTKVENLDTKASLLAAIKELEVNVNNE
jgi:hypothetical protein